MQALIDPRGHSYARELLETYVRNDDFSGGAVIAAKNGRIVLEHYAGDARPGLPAGPDVLWPLASISKLYSVAMIMRLVERGALTLNTLVSQVLPRFTGEGREQIRLRHLLTHTSGLIYESPEMEARLAAQTPIAALVDEAMTAPLQFVPGSSIAYADYNTLIAGRMAEIVMGRSFAELVCALVLEPMVLHDTFMPPPSDQLARIAHVRGVLAEGTPGAMYNSPYALGLAHPAFGAVATTRDLLRFVRHFAPGGPRIHSAATVRAMLSDQAGGVRAMLSDQAGGVRGKHVALAGLNPDARITWGLGWMLQSADTPALFSDLAALGSFGHGGASGCHVCVDPSINLTVAVVSNSHVRLGRDAWQRRLQSMLNACFMECAD